MSDFDHTDDPAMKLPENATLLLEREGIDAYLISAADENGAVNVPHLVFELPAKDGILLGGAGTNLGDTDALSVEYAAYRTYSLSDIAQVRDDHERLRDQMRYDHGDTPPGQQFDLAAIQTVIDIFVIVERAIEYSETDDRAERGRHYRRVSALCEDPRTVIETIEGVLADTPQPTGVLEKLRERVRRARSET